MNLMYAVDREMYPQLIAYSWFECVNAKLIFASHENLYSMRSGTIFSRIERPAPLIHIRYTNFSLHGTRCDLLSSIVDLKTLT